MELEKKASSKRTNASINQLKTEVKNEGKLKIVTGITNGKKPITNGKTNNFKIINSEKSQSINPGNKIVKSENGNHLRNSSIPPEMRSQKKSNGIKNNGKVDGELPTKKKLSSQNHPDILSSLNGLSVIHSVRNKRKFLSPRKRLINNFFESISVPVETQCEECPIQKIRDKSEALKEFEHIKANLYVNRSPRFIEDNDVQRCNCPKVKEGEKGCTNSCVNRQTFIECGSNCINGEQCSNRRLTHRKFPRKCLTLYENKGFGIKSKEIIKSNSLVGEYIGEVINEEELKKRQAKYHNDHQYIMSLSFGEYIDATRAAGAYRFMNHSCEPNCKIEKWNIKGEYRMGIFSLRTIESGEELTFDYQFTSHGNRTTKCYCGSRKCRIYIETKAIEKKRKRRKLNEVPHLFEVDNILDEEKIYDPVLFTHTSSVFRPSLCHNIYNETFKILEKYSLSKLDAELKAKNKHKLFLNRNIYKTIDNYMIDSPDGYDYIIDKNGNEYIKTLPEDK